MNPKLEAMANADLLAIESEWHFETMRDLLKFVENCEKSARFEDHISNVVRYSN